MAQIPRIIFNFNDRCLNGCPFCFIPFDGEGSADVGLWREILARANEFSPEMISFSGCDPFYYDDFYTLLETAEKKSYWGVDTSLIWLDKDRFAGCCHRLDQISTSWDDVPEMPRVQRYGGEKYLCFVDNVEFVLQYAPQLVVHTLYSEKNQGHLEAIADALIQRQVKTWSIYQFWPFDFIRHTGDYLVDAAVFEKRGQEITQYVGGRLDFEYVPYANRANGYFFVSSKGKVYTTLGGPVGSYKVLGSVFDRDIYEKWSEWSHPAAAGDILQRKIQREMILRAGEEI